MASRTTSSRASRRQQEGSPYKRVNRAAETQSAPSTPRGRGSRLLSGLTGLIWGTPKAAAQEDEDLEDNDNVSQDLTIEAISDSDDSPPALVSAPINPSKGWNDPPFPESAPSTAGTYGQNGAPPGAFGMQQQQQPQNRQRQDSVVSVSATERLEEFFRLKRERGEALSTEEAVDVVRLVSEGTLSFKRHCCRSNHSVG